MRQLVGYDDHLDSGHHPQFIAPPSFFDFFVQNSEKLPKYGKKWIQMGTLHLSETNALLYYLFKRILQYTRHKNLYRFPTAF